MFDFLYEKELFVTQNLLIPLGRKQSLAKRQTLFSTRGINSNLPHPTIDRKSHKFESHNMTTRKSHKRSL